MGPSRKMFLPLLELRLYVVLKHSCLCKKFKLSLRTETKKESGDLVTTVALLGLSCLIVVMQVIYIAPLKAIVRERMNDWRKHLVSQLGKKMVINSLC